MRRTLFVVVMMLVVMTAHVVVAQAEGYRLKTNEKVYEKVTYKDRTETLEWVYNGGGKFVNTLSAGGSTTIYALQKKDVKNFYADSALSKPITNLDEFTKKYENPAGYDSQSSLSPESPTPAAASPPSVQVPATAPPAVPPSSASAATPAAPPPATAPPAQGPTALIDTPGGHHLTQEQLALVANGVIWKAGYDQAKREGSLGDGTRYKFGTEEQIVTIPTGGSATIKIGGVDYNNVPKLLAEKADPNGLVSVEEAGNKLVYSTKAVTYQHGDKRFINDQNFAPPGQQAQWRTISVQEQKDGYTTTREWARGTETNNINNGANYKAPDTTTITTTAGMSFEHSQAGLIIKRHGTEVEEYSGTWEYEPEKNGAVKLPPHFREADGSRIIVPHTGGEAGGWTERKMDGTTTKRIRVYDAGGNLYAQGDNTVMDYYDQQTGAIYKRDTIPDTVTGLDTNTDAYVVGDAWVDTPINGDGPGDKKLGAGDFIIGPGGYWYEIKVDSVTERVSREPVDSTKQDALVKQADKWEKENPEKIPRGGFSLFGVVTNPNLFWNGLTKAARVGQYASIYRPYHELSSLLFGREFMSGWRESVDQAFASAYLGVEYWESAVCQGEFDVVGGSVGAIERSGGLVQFIGNIQAERSPPVPLLCGEGGACKKGQCRAKDAVCILNGQPVQEFFYKISYGVTAPDDEKLTPFADETGAVSFNIVLTGPEKSVPILPAFVETQNGEVKKDIIVKYSPRLYTKACVVFEKKALGRNGEVTDICTDIVEGMGSFENAQGAGTAAAQAPAEVDW